MRRIVPVALVLCFVLPSTVSAQNTSPPSISVNVDREPIVQGQPFRLQISISSQGRGDPKVDLPRLSGFRVLKQYESHPSTFSFSFGFGGGQTTNIQRKESNYTFVLVADKPGKHRIDPVMVTVDGRKYKGETYQVDVLKANAAQGGAPSLTPIAPGGQQGGAEPDEEEIPASGTVVETLDGAKVEPDYFIQTAVSKKEAVVGEMLVMTVYLYMAQSLSNYEILREPGTEGFWGENLIPANRRRLTTESVMVQGRAYERAVLRKMALFPIKPGKLTIAPTIVDVEIQPGMFFSRRRSVKRASLPVTVTVADLPAENQPANFNPANVGRYTFRVGVDNTSVKVGEPVTLTLRVKGVGNLRNLVLPTPAEIPGLKIYDPETDVDVKQEGDIVSGSLTSRILMIPTEPGEFTIPEIAWPYFDPASETYKTPTSKPVVIQVSKGQVRTSAAAVAGPVDGQVSRVGQDRLNRQLRSILSRVDLGTPSSGHPLTRPWFLLLAIGVPVLYLGFWLVSRTRRKMRESKGKNRAKNADSEALKRLGVLRKQQAEIASEEFFKALEESLIGFIEDRLEEKALGDTLSELRERLTERGFPHDLTDRVVAETEACDFARFARGAGQEEERHRALDRMEALIRDLARVKVAPKKRRSP